jgi:3-methyladenine DNA glycosylase AlkC
MAEPLKNHFGERVPRTIAAQIVAVRPEFAGDAFVAEVLEEYETLELMARGRRIARVLRRYLPLDYREALGVLLRSIGERPSSAGGDGGWASFLYLPHVTFVAEFGLEDFEASMNALYHLTQRFTGEFSIRPFLEKHGAETLALLTQWARDPNAHVRRLVSEGTRPRLPWAGRLEAFQLDPAPVVELLELLKDDPEEFVRRSVANNLNDIGKDHPELLVAISRRWMAGASDERRALVRHALRSLIKQGHPDALDVLGFGERASVALDNIRIAPERVERGGKVAIEFWLRGRPGTHQRVLVDLRIHYVKANGRTSPKVFKLRSLDLGPTPVVLRKTLSVADMTTRRHYSGSHAVEVLVNGRVEPLGSFEVVEPT